MGDPLGLLPLEHRRQQGLDGLDAGLRETVAAQVIDVREVALVDRKRRALVRADGVVDQAPGVLVGATEKRALKDQLAAPPAADALALAQGGLAADVLGRKGPEGEAADLVPAFGEARRGAAPHP